MPVQVSPRKAASADAFVRRIDETLATMAPALAERLGPPAGSERFTRSEVDDLWDTPDVSLRRDALYEALQQGLPQQAAEQIALFRMSPDLGRFVTGRPLDPRTAAAIAKLAEYPGRYVLTAEHSADPSEQVKYVEDMHERAAPRSAPAGPETRAALPAPVPPPGGY